MVLISHLYVCADSSLEAAVCDLKEDIEILEEQFTPTLSPGSPWARSLSSCDSPSQSVGATAYLDSEVP